METRIAAGPVDQLDSDFARLRANALGYPCRHKAEVVSGRHQLALPGKVVWLGVYRRCDVFGQRPAWHATLAVYTGRTARLVGAIGDGQRRRLLALLADCLGPVGAGPDAVSYTERAVHLSRELSAEEAEVLAGAGHLPLPLLS